MGDGGRFRGAPSAARRVVLELERHVLGSPADAFDTAWSTYGWTPALADRTGSLEEMVPWGTPTTRKEAPGWLSGDAGSVADTQNLDRLGSAVLPMNGSLGYSVWGASGRERSGSGWRVLTHTVLLDPWAFARISGHPEGLLGRQGRPADWLRSLVEDEDFERPTELPTITVPTTRDEETRYRRDRLRTIARLRTATLQDRSVDELVGLLAGIFEGLAAVLADEHLHHVVLRDSGETASRLIRLAWLSLPFADRAMVGYATEQSRTERPRGQLIGLAPDEWGDTVPGGSIVVGDESTPPGAGRWEWASMVADPTLWEAFIQADRRAGAGGLRLVAGDDLATVAEQRSWRTEWVTRGPSIDGALRLLENEVTRGRGPRLWAAGVVLGEALVTGDPADLAAALKAAGALQADDRARWLGGAVRRLRREGRAGSGLAARLRLSAAEEFGGEDARRLHRLVDRESDALKALLSGPGGGRELLLGSISLAETGDAVGRELVRLGVGEASWEADLVDQVEARSSEAVLVEIMSALSEVCRDEPERARVLTAMLAHAMAKGVSTDGLVRLLRAVPVDRFPDAWEQGLSQAPIDTFRNPTVLAELIEATRAGQAPWTGDGPMDGPARVARVAVDRLLEQDSSSAPPEAVLRLLWAAGTPEPLDRIPQHARVPTLTSLLTAPAPLPLYFEIRGRIPLGQPASALPARSLESLRTYAPAVASALEDAASQPGRRVWVEVGS